MNRLAEIAVELIPGKSVQVVEMTRTEARAFWDDTLAEHVSDPLYEALDEAQGAALGQESYLVICIKP